MQLLDAYGNWAPTINQEDWTPGNSSGGVLSGAGAPDNSLGVNGDIYINITNGDIYTKSGDTWIIQDGSGGGSGSNLLGVVDPGGTVTPTAVGQFYTNTAAVPLPQIWQAEGLTNADWRLRT